MARARSLGITTFTTYTTGAQVLDYAGHQSHFTGLIPPLPSPTPISVVCLGKIVGLQVTVPLDKPWTAPGAAALDSQTLETFKLANTSTPGARFLLDLATRPSFAAEPRDLSLLHALFYFNSGGGIINLTSTAGGAQDSRFVGGSQLVSIRMAERLGHRVVLEAPVRRISQSRSGVVIDSDKGAWRAARDRGSGTDARGTHRLRAGAAALRDQLTQRMPQGSVIKFEAVYPTPFWRAAGLSGYTNSDRAPVRFTYDNLRRRNAGGAARIRLWRGRSASRHAGARAAPQGCRVVRAAVRAGGRPRMLIEHNWSDEVWTPGLLRGATCRVWADSAQPCAPVGRACTRLGTGDLRDLQRLHGRRRALGRASRDRGGPGLAPVVAAAASAAMKSMARSPIISVGAFVLPDVMNGMTDASATRRPSMPWTRSRGSTTASESMPILQVPTWWW